MLSHHRRWLLRNDNVKDAWWISPTKKENSREKKVVCSRACSSHSSDGILNPNRKSVHNEKIIFPAICAPKNENFAENSSISTHFRVRDYKGLSTILRKTFWDSTNSSSPPFEMLKCHWSSRADARGNNIFLCKTSKWSKSVSVNVFT